MKAQVREETRRVRREARSFRHGSRDRWRGRGRRQGLGPIAPLVMIFAVLGLTAARCATFALFRVFLPVLLGFLSLFFGRPLRRAAYACREVGRHGDVGLQHALDAVRSALFGHRIDVDGEALEADVAPPAARTRASADRPRVEPNADDLADFDERLAERERREPR